MTTKTQKAEGYGFAAPRGRVYDSVVNLVGGTPLVALPHLTQDDGLKARLLIKLEFFNPLGSVKDRIGAAMVLDAERRGLITPGRTLLVELHRAIRVFRWHLLLLRAGTGWLSPCPRVLLLSGGGCCA